MMFTKCLIVICSLCAICAILTACTSQEISSEDMFIEGSFFSPSLMLDMNGVFGRFKLKKY